MSHHTHTSHTSDPTDQGRQAYHLRIAAGTSIYLVHPNSAMEPVILDDDLNISDATARLSPVDGGRIYCYDFLYQGVPTLVMAELVAEAIHQPHHSQPASSAPNSRDERETQRVVYHHGQRYLLEVWHADGAGIEVSVSAIVEQHVPTFHTSDDSPRGYKTLLDSVDAWVRQQG